MEINRVWFVCHYSMPPKYEMRIKTQKYAHYLGTMGIDCTIFSASTLHNTNINLINDKSLYVEKKYDDLKFVHIRCSDYTKTDIKRIVNMEQFAYRFKKVAERFSAPDVIVSDTYCISYKPIYSYCRKHSVPFVLDVRDLWPQSIVEYLHFSENNPIIRLMYRAEKKMFIRSDRIIFSMDGGYDYIRDRHLESFVEKDKVFFINNGVDLDEFKRNMVQFTVDDADINCGNIYKVVYAGSIRKVNNVGILLDAAKLIRNPKVKILIWGDGDELGALKERVSKEAIANVVFKGRVEKKYIPYITSHADLNLIHNNPSDLFKYGVSFNKIFDYLASGKPSLSTFPCKYNPAVMSGAGIAIEEQNPKAIADGIEFMADNEVNDYCLRAREAAEEYDFRHLSNKLLEILQEVCQKKKKTSLHA